MAINQEKTNELLDLFRRKFPSFESFKDPEFIEEEVKYKEKTIRKAYELINQEALSLLIEEENYDEFISRIEKIGKDNNLLWFSIPLQGDLNILYDEKLDKHSFCSAFYNLLYGKAESTERMQQYLDYLDSHDLPNKWTFPTYFLFICHPEQEYFVKPETAKWFMSFIDESAKWGSKPTSEIYGYIRNYSHELKDALALFQPKDMIDIQGFIWVCHYLAKSSLLKKEKRDEFSELFQEFITSYPKSKAGEEHKQMLIESREVGKNNFKEVKGAADRGEDITDLVLQKLLPHSGSSSTREIGAWISIAPVINLDIKKWFEELGWTKSADWPKISNAIFSFVDNSNKYPEKLKEFCTEFSSLSYTKGIQSGFLSPILNALKPEEFNLVNNKPVKVINYLVGSSYTTNLGDYPDFNQHITRLVEDLSSEMDKFEKPDISDRDLFDMFCHWLVALKKHKFREIQYWKIAPGEYAKNWEDCKSGSFISVGWDELGDISEMNHSEYISKRDELVTELGWKKTGVDQVWRFARQIKEDDYIIANHGTSEVLGIGRVNGSYYYVQDEEYAHRLPVEWIDLKKRKVNEQGWRRTLLQFDEQKFRDIIKATIPEPVLASGVVKEVAAEKYGCPFRQKTFELLEELHHNPTRELYSSKMEDFKEYVINPMRQLFQKVADELPDPITDLMETKSKIFSRIPKNDFGLGGAWDYYWGAFYPKGGKRVEDAQLSICIKKDRFEYGFYIGEYGSEQRKTFVKNCKENFEVLQNLIKESLDHESILYGTRDELATTKLLQSSDRTSISWDEWLLNPEETGISVSVVLLKEEILQLSGTELKNKIIEGFIRLFPLVLLAASESPIQAINDYFEQIEKDIDVETHPIYSLDKLLADTGLEVDVLQRWIQAIERKKQAIIFGPPGTGKTYVARLLAKHLIGGSDGLSDIIQFHPAYAYEDFIQGIRPQTRSDGALDFKLIPGRFLDFCSEAKKRSGKCVLIIDEINRANLARVFGELMYLLEYREESIPLSQGDHLTIPKNVRFIGTMNTADRSIALVDHALRRRFAFLPLYPNFNILTKFHKDTDFPIKPLIEILEKLNAEIDDKHYHVGITFFLNKNLKDNIEDIWKMEIEPYLEEYFYDQQEKAKEFNWVKIQDKLQ
ncbi:AAA family ATPase [Acidobacteriota bacterium]